MHVPMCIILCGCVEYIMLILEIINNRWCRFQPQEIKKCKEEIIINFIISSCQLITFNKIYLLIKPNLDVCLISYLDI